MLLLLACTENIGFEIGWPETGCTSEHQPALDSVEIAREEFTVNGLTVGVLRPRPEGCWPALVLVPPGFDEGLPELDEEVSEDLAGSGLVVVAFDPPGRGLSEGVEDHGGLGHQDALAALLSWVAARDDVDPQRVVLRSRSFGLTMASGALHRHEELGVLALVDLEGPVALPEDLEHVTEQSRAALYDVATGPDWWVERSPSEHLGFLSARYRRIQALEDHATGSWLGHAQAAVNEALDGSAASVDLNQVERERWSYEDVLSDALGGRVKHDDSRAVELVLDLFE